MKPAGDVGGAAVAILEDLQEIVAVYSVDLFRTASFEINSIHIAQRSLELR